MQEYISISRKLSSVKAKANNFAMAMPSEDQEMILKKLLREMNNGQLDANIIEDNPDQNLSLNELENIVYDFINYIP